MLTFACTSTQRTHSSRGTSNQMWDGGRNTQWSPDFFLQIFNHRFFVQTCSVGGFLRWICVVWVFLGSKRTDKLQDTSSHTWVGVVFHGFTVRSFFETSQVVQRFHNQLATCPQHDIESRELQKNPNPMAEMPDFWPSFDKNLQGSCQGFLLTKDARCFLGNM